MARSQVCACASASHGGSPAGHGTYEKASWTLAPEAGSLGGPGSSDKIDKRNGKMKRRGSSKGGRRNFETWKNPPAQPSPTEKQKLDVVSHSALLSSSPGTPAGPQKQLSSRRASEEVSVELCTSSQAERNMQNGLCQAGQEGHRPDVLQVRGGGPQVAPTPQPRMQVPSLRPIGPCPCPYADSPAVAGPESGAERGPRSRARRTRQPPLLSAKPPPALGVGHSLFRSFAVAIGNSSI
eukprot:bmy_04853T0